MKLTKYKKYLPKLFLFIIILTFLSFLWGIYKPLPKGVNYESQIYNISEEEIQFLTDVTYTTNSNNISKRHINQSIFENVFDIISNAEEFIVIDMFLFGENDYSNNELINISSKLKLELIKAKQNNSDLKIYFITDYFNTFYGTYKSDLVKELEDNNITVIFTEVKELRDSNPIYSSFWRIFLMPFGRDDFEGGFLPNVISEEPEKISLRSVFELLNFKVNHRKIILSEKEIIITSANPHTASSLHSNVAIKIKNKDFVNEVLKSEKLVAEFSKAHINISINDGEKINKNKNKNNSISLKYITESKIRDVILFEIETAKKGEKINIGMFYLSHRDVINEIKNAIERGVKVNLILDPNKDAFGREKKGIPNRQVALELEDAGANIRWYNTNGEQFHTKIFIKETKDNKIIIILGSCNYTKRNMDNYNLEANVWLEVPTNSNLSNTVLNYWEEISKFPYTLNYYEYEDTSKIRYWLYRFQEFTGLSTF